MKQIKVGTFRLGFENVDLYARSDDGGEFYFVPDLTSPPRIKVGMDYPQNHADEVLNVLLHEALEFLIARHDCRFHSSNKFNGDNACFTFIFDHPRFTTVVSELAHFIEAAWPALHRVWKRWKKPLDKRRPPRKRRHAQARR